MEWKRLINQTSAGFRKENENAKEHVSLEDTYKSTAERLSMKEHNRELTFQYMRNMQKASKRVYQGQIIDH